MPMDYDDVQLPFVTPVQQLSKAEARQYAAWYHQQVPVRIAILERAVRSTSGYEDWRADETPESLHALGRWFAGQVELRPKSQEELDRERAEAGERWADTVETHTLTYRTMSMAYDIGMYWGALMVRALPQLSWKLIERSPRDADYHQPVLIAPGNPQTMNPINLTRVAAWGLADGQRDGRVLYDLYRIWLGVLACEIDIEGRVPTA
jgi:hypothetical protein